MLNLSSIRQAHLLASVSHRVLKIVMPADTLQLARSMKAAWVMFGARG